MKRDEPGFEHVDWKAISRSRRFLTRERVVLLLGVGFLSLLYGYDRIFAGIYTLGSWRVTTLDFVFLLSIVVLVAYGIVPLLERRERVRSIVAGLGPAATVALGYLVVFVVVGLVGPAIISNPGLRFDHAFQPPVGFTSQVAGPTCLGAVTGGPFTELCHGTWTYPLGTNHRGLPLGFLLVSGARTAVMVLVISLVTVVPIAAAVGLIAGFRGGLVDTVLVSYVDIQLSIPAIVFYFLGYSYWGPSLLLLIVAFGLLSWGGIARLVRSEVIQRREAGHVRIARSLGAPDRYVIRRHVLPNVTNTLVPAVFQVLALLILFEAGVAFLGYHELELYSWGATISEGINAEVAGQMQTRAAEPGYKLWWVSTWPALALTATLASLKVLGDGLRDELDPRGGHS
ncbi:MAG: ABC transporter permease [Halodesulfurarchaeum sp.]